MKAIITLLAFCFFSIHTYSQWVLLPTGCTLLLNDICFIDSYTGISAGANGSIIRTSNSGTSWTSVNCPTGQNINTLCFPSILVGYASGQTGFIVKTINSGSSWFSTSPCGINVRSISFINENTGITGGGGTLMCFTTNGGSGWSPKYTPTPHAVSGVHFVNIGLLMVSASDLPGSVIHKSTNAGVNWSTVLTLNNSGLNITYNLTSVYFKDNTTGFSTGSHTSYGQVNAVIYRSTSGGDSWVSAAAIGPAAGNCINAVHFGDNDTGFAAGNNGMILRTTNSGENWSVQVSGITTVLTNVFMLNALTGYICGANGTILKTTNGGVMGFKPIGNEIPEEFALYQNYPNPFNPATKIKFDLPKSNLTMSEAKGLNVTLIIYDILGKELAALVNEQLQPGTYEVEWPASQSIDLGSNYTSGIYIYQLKTDDFVQSKKMILLK